MSHKDALQLANFPLARECSGNPVCWEQTQLTVDATEVDEHHRTQIKRQHVSLVPQEPPQGHRPAKF